MIFDFSLCFSDGNGNTREESGTEMLEQIDFMLTRSSLAPYQAKMPANDGTAARSLERVLRSASKSCVHQLCVSLDGLHLALDFIL
jgi:hypothetical protein